MAGAVALCFCCVLYRLLCIVAFVECFWVVRIVIVVCGFCILILPTIALVAACGVAYVCLDMRMCISSSTIRQCIPAHVDLEIGFDAHAHEDVHVYAFVLAQSCIHICVNVCTYERMHVRTHVCTSLVVLCR